MGSSHALTSSWGGTTNAGKSPRKWRDTTVAMTDAMTMGLNSDTPKSPRMISTANRAPATGALKVAAMPAAAPHPTSVRSWGPLTLNH